MTSRHWLSRIKHWIEARIVAPLFRPLFRTSRPTEPLELLIRRFDAELQTSGGSPATNKTWVDLLDAIKTQAKQMRVELFLHWPAIRYGMFGSDQPYTREELRRLRKRGDWPRWKTCLQEDAFGSPVPSRFYPLTSPTLIHQAHHIATLEDQTCAAISAFNLIVEFGGGYGSLCRLARRAGFRGSYVIFDLPPMTALQRLYLSALGLGAEPLEERSAIEAARNCLTSDLPTLLTWLDHHLPKAGKTLFIATWSLSEAPVELRKHFIDRLSQFSTAFIAFQSQFEDIDNSAYLQAAELRLPGWKFQTLNIPGMDPAAGCYWIGMP